MHIWKIRNFRLLWTASFVGEMGLWFGLVGNLQFMQDKVESAFLQSLILLAGLAVGLLFGPMAGRLIDRSPIKPLLLTVGLIRLLGIGFMFLALATDSIFWMVVYTIIGGVTSVFYNPALQAVMPLIVPPDQLLSANGLQMNAYTMSRIVGAGLAGVAVAYIDLYWVYVVTLVGYCGLLVLTSFLQLDESAKAEGKQQEKVRFQEVLPIIKARPRVVSALLLAFVPTFFLAGFNINVVAIAKLVGADEIKGLLYTIEGIAFLLGSFLVKRAAEGRDALKFMMAAGLIIILAQFSLHFAEYYFVSVLAFTLSGFACGMFFPLTATLQQTEIPGEYHGRFFAFRGMIDTIMWQVLTMISGALLDLTGLPNMVVIFGACSTAMLTVLFLRMKNSPRVKTGAVVNNQIENV